MKEDFLVCRRWADMFVYEKWQFLHKPVKEWGLGSMMVAAPDVDEVSTVSFHRQRWRRARPCCMVSCVLRWLCVRYGC